MNENRIINDTVPDKTSEDLPNWTLAPDEEELLFLYRASNDELRGYLLAIARQLTEPF